MPLSVIDWTAADTTGKTRLTRSTTSTECWIEKACVIRERKKGRRGREGEREEERKGERGREKRDGRREGERKEGRKGVTNLWLSTGYWSKLSKSGGEEGGVEE